jgi:hypothetical protein
LGDAVLEAGVNSPASITAANWLNSSDPMLRTPASWLASLNGILVKESL